MLCLEIVSAVKYKVVPFDERFNVGIIYVRNYRLDTCFRIDLGDTLLGSDRLW